MWAHLDNDSGIFWKVELRFEVVSLKDNLTKLFWTVTCDKLARFNRANDSKLAFYNEGCELGCCARVSSRRALAERVRLIDIAVLSWGLNYKAFYGHIAISYSVCHCQSLPSLFGTFRQGYEPTISAESHKWIYFGKLQHLLQILV